MHCLSPFIVINKNIMGKFATGSESDVVLPLATGKSNWMLDTMVCDRFARRNHIFLALSSSSLPFFSMVFSLIVFSMIHLTSRRGEDAQGWGEGMA